MKLLNNLAALVCLIATPSLFAENLKISSSSMETIKISNDDSTTLNFNFLVKTVKPILKQEDSVVVTLLDRGLVITPNQDNAKGIVVITNDKGNSYSVKFEATSKSDVKIDGIYNFTDLSYTKDDDVNFDFESSNVEQDVTSVVKSLDNNVPLSGFDKTTVPYTIQNNEFSMERVERYTGTKYVVEKWLLKNTSKDVLYFENRDFASEGMISISISPEEVQPNEVATGYFVINKSTILNTEKQD